MDAGVDSGTPMPTMLAASGALTGSISAAKPTVGYEATSMGGSFFLSRGGSGLPFTVQVAINFTGVPAAMTYTQASPGFSCDVTVTSGTATADTWVARYMTPSGADVGSCSLTFTSATSGAGGYVVSGSLDITADTFGGASSGMVNLTGTF